MTRQRYIATIPGWFGRAGVFLLAAGLAAACEEETTDPAATSYTSPTGVGSVVLDMPSASLTPSIDNGVNVTVSVMYANGLPIPNAPVTVVTTAGLLGATGGAATVRSVAVTTGPAGEPAVLTLIPGEIEQLGVVVATSAGVGSAMQPYTVGSGAVAAATVPTPTGTTVLAPIAF